MTTALLAVAPPAAAGGPAADTAVAQVNQQSPPQITFFHCESGGSIMVCAASISGGWTSITWYRHWGGGTWVVAHDVTSIGISCVPGDSYSVEVSNAAGTTTAQSFTPCNTGPWQ